MPGKGKPDMQFQPNIDAIKALPKQQGLDAIVAEGGARPSPHPASSTQGSPSADHTHTFPAHRCDALFLPGGHGPMWDLAESDTCADIVLNFYDSNKPIGAVCHGPAGISTFSDYSAANLRAVLMEPEPTRPKTHRLLRHHCRASGGNARQYRRACAGLAAGPHARAANHVEAVGCADGQAAPALVLA